MVCLPSENFPSGTVEQAAIPFQSTGDVNSPNGGISKGSPFLSSARTREGGRGCGGGCDLIKEWESAQLLPVKARLAHCPERKYNVIK